jgi:hypothetical protein
MGRSFNVIIHSIPMVSTAHISKAADEWLTYGYNPWAIIASYEGGHFICTALHNIEMLPNLPKSLAVVLTWAFDNKYNWIQLDRDGDIVPELPQYKW